MVVVADPRQTRVTMQKIFDTHNPAPLPLGCVSNARGAPDVECAALVLTDVPLIAEAFEGGRDWAIVKVLLVQVGPPGFSMAPYSSGKPVDKKELRRLYELSEEGDTVLYSFKKVSNNKNKGERVEQGETPDGQTVDLRTPLLAGTVVKLFLQKDKVAMNSMGAEGHLVAGASGDSSPFVNLDNVRVATTKLCAGDCVVVNVRSKNAEQAGKGNLLNVTKLTVVRRALFRHEVAARMPASPARYEELAGTVSKFAGLKECVDMERATFFALTPNADWYVSSKDFDETRNLVLCDGAANAFVLPWRLVREVFNCRAVAEGCKSVRKVLDMMLARECLKITVRLPSFRGLRFNDEEAMVLHLSVDEARFLDIDALRAVKGAQTAVDGLSASVVQHEGATWVAAEMLERRIPCGEAARSMVVCVCAAEESGSDEWWGEHLATEGGAAIDAAFSFAPPPGTSYKMHLCTRKSEAWNVATDFTSVEAAREQGALTLHATVWWQSQSGGGRGGGGRKRMREDMSSDEDE